MQARAPHQSIAKRVPDGIADYIDLDSDDDGIPDIVEAQPTIGYTGSADGDVTDQDADGDGVIDIFDSNDGTTQDLWRLLCYSQC